MGSFSMTCALSGLPIECGDKVRYYLLTQNPYYESGNACHTYDIWAPRVYPLRAKYDDYGSVEDVESGAVREAWYTAFDIDMVERGWGDNSCHDVSTAKRMPFDDLLRAIAEGRVQVQRQVDLHNRFMSKEMKEIFAKVDKDKNKAAPEISKGIPTLERITAVIQSVGLEVFNGNHSPKEMMLDDDEGFGRIRVRQGDFGEANLDNFAKVEKAAKAAGYATMLTHGTGGYSHDRPELLIRPLPNAKGYGFRKGDAKSPLYIAHAMIREDVWQAVCKMSVPGFISGQSTADGYVNGAKEAWKVLSETSIDPYLKGISLKNYASAFGRDLLPFVLGHTASFLLVMEQADKMTQAQIDDFLRTAGEFMFIQHVMATVRIMYRPSYSNGPQLGEWAAHEQFLSTLAGVAKPKREEADAERAEWTRLDRKAETAAKRKKKTAKTKRKVK